MLSWPENRLREASVLRIATTVLAGALCLGPAWAAKVVQFTPQGIVSKIESVKLAFDSAVTAFGAGQAASPPGVVCNDPAINGDRTSVVKGKSVSVSVDLGGGRIRKKKRH